MKRPHNLLIIIAILFFITNVTQNISAQTSKSKEKIIVELIIEKEAFEQKFEVPVDMVLKENESPPGGSFATVDCTNCPLISEYSFWITESNSINENQSNISFEVSFKNKSRCSVRKTIVVSRNKKTTYKLKCGVKVVAYYE